MAKHSSKWKIGRIANAILGIAAFLMIGITGLSEISQWNWSDTFRTVILFAVGIYLIGQSSVKNVQSLKNMAKSTNGVIHLFSFGLGLVTIYLALTSIPAIAGFNLPSLAKFNGWIMLFSGLFSIIEGFVK